MRSIYLIYKKIFEIVSEERKKSILFSIILGIINSLIDVISLSTIFPAAYIATHTEVIYQNRILSSLYKYLKFSNPDYFVLFILIAVLLLFLFRMFLSVLIFRFQQSNIFKASVELSKVMSENFFLKNILEIKKTTIGELDKEIRVLPNQFSNFILMPLIMIISEIIVIGIILFSIISFNFKLFILLLISIFPFVFIFNKILRRKVEYLGIELNQFSTQSFNHSRELISGYADIKMQNQSNYFIQKLIKSLNSYNDVQIKINTFQQISPKLLEWSALLSVVIIYLFAIQNQESKSDIVVILAVYMAAAYRLFPSLNRINSSMILIRQYEFILDIFYNAKMNLQKYQHNFSPQNIHFEKKISLKNIGLSYSNDASNFVLKNIHLQIHKGEILGLVGSSGSGKTSLVYIISGLLPPTNGKLLVDNIEITSENLNTWQKNIAFVYQDIFLINGSILDNITFGDDKPDIDRVWECLKSVQLDEFVKSLPDTIHTPVGESGGYLSGGQKQRLVIARALYKKVSLIILDEATSALDEHTQESVVKNIHQLSKQNALTVILIAHRLSSLKYCDKIIQLKDGEIVGEYTYKQVLEQHNV